MYDLIAKNKRRSVLLVAGLLVLAGGFGYLFGYVIGGPGWGGPLVAVMIVALMSWSSYRWGDRLVLRVSKARPASREEHARLHNVAEGLAIAAGVPKPALYVIPGEAPNAFATGRDPEHASVAVTEGLLRLMNRVELEGVIAHELSHVRNRDILVGTLVATLVGVVVLLSEWLLRIFWWGGGRGRSREQSGAGPWAAIAVVAALVLAVLGPLAAQLIRFAVSRRREYLADADGALLTRYPPGLQSALRKIAENTQPLAAATDATAHLWLAKPSRTPGEGWTRLERLFSTHPPIEERIRILEEM